MGAADIVPGVSGGTVALILGIYGDLVANIGKGSSALTSLLRGDLSGFVTRLREVDWVFLIPLFTGIATSVLVLAGLIETALHDYPETMAGLFFGLVIGSIVVARKLLVAPDLTHTTIALLVGAATFALLGFQSGPALDPSPVALLAAGALAVCAMILPGISGSFILVMIGMYAAVLSAVDERDLADIALVGLGAILGLALFSQLLTRLLTKYHDYLMASLIGLMFGSLRVLWPWPNGVGFIDRDASETIDGTGLSLPGEDPWFFAVLLAVVATIGVVAASAVVRRTPLSAD